MKELIESLGWPHITLIFGVVFIILFRKQIGSFLQRVRSVSKNGLVTDTEAEIAQQNKNEPETDILQHMDIEKSRLLEQVESLIFEDLKTRKLEHDNKTVKVLVRNLAISKISHDHEQTYNAIFGSQIFLMKKLNEVSGTGHPEEYIEGYYKQVQDDNNGVFDKWTLTHYLGYMAQRNLITIKDNNWHITDKGQDFLVWLVKSAKPENKGL